MSRHRLNFLFLNLGHFLDHLFMLVFATVAALRLAEEWDMSYAALIPYATPGFVAFGVCAIPAGWIADKWSRAWHDHHLLHRHRRELDPDGIGGFAGRDRVGTAHHGCVRRHLPPRRNRDGHTRDGGRPVIPIAINGVFGNLGVAAAALLTGYLIDTGGWRNAFVLPGAVSIGLGAAYAAFVWAGRGSLAVEPRGDLPEEPSTVGAASIGRPTFVRVLSVIGFTTAIGGLIFQSTTFSLPKIFDERLHELAGSATAVGGYAFLVFAIAALAQLVVGYLVDRYSVRTVFALVAALQSMLFAFMYQLTGVPALIVAIAFMLVVFGQLPINDVLIGRVTNSEWRSRVFSLRYIVTFSVAAAVLPVIAGIHATWGFGALFVVMAVAASGIFAAALMLPRAGGGHRAACGCVKGTPRSPESSGRLAVSPAP